MLALSSTRHKRDSEASPAEILASQFDDPWDYQFFEFRHSILKAYPDRFANLIAEEYVRIHESQGRQKANLFLLDIKDELTTQNISLASKDSDLVNFAKRRANEFQRLAYSFEGSDKLLQILCDLAYYKYGVIPKIKDRKNQEAETVSLTLPNERNVTVNVKPDGIIARLCNEHWWRRSLRCIHIRNVEAKAIQLGLVRNGKDKYVSNETLNRIKQQKQRNKSILEQCIAVNELDQEYTLQQLSELSVSNPKNQRNELMTRLAGIDKTAELLNFTGLVFTVTCPSRMHRSRTLKNKASSVLNPSYDNTRPDEAQKYLNRVWARIRAQLGREKIEVFGIRVAEPHQDGTPHWHILLYVAPRSAKKLKQIVRHYALEDSPHEDGAQQRRVDTILIDRKKGSGTSYLAKYISKNIDGFKFDDLVDGLEAPTAAERTKAWASTWGIRQFQFIGGPSVTIWREIRKVTSENLQGLVKEIWEACHEGEWGKFILLMGGCNARRKNMPISLATRWNDKPNRYLEPKGLELIGIAYGNLIIPTRLHQWKITYARKTQGRPEARRALETPSIETPSIETPSIGYHHNGNLAPLEFYQ